MATAHDPCACASKTPQNGEKESIFICAIATTPGGAQELWSSMLTGAVKSLGEMRRLLAMSGPLPVQLYGSSSPAPSSVFGALAG